MSLPVTEVWVLGSGLVGVLQASLAHGHPLGWGGKYSFQTPAPGAAWGHETGTVPSIQPVGLGTLGTCQPPAKAPGLPKHTAHLWGQEQNHWSEQTENVPAQWTCWGTGVRVTERSGCVVNSHHWGPGRLGAVSSPHSQGTIREPRSAAKGAGDKVTHDMPGYGQTRDLEDR